MFVPMNPFAIQKLSFLNCIQSLPAQTFFWATVSAPKSVAAMRVLLLSQGTEDHMTISDLAVFEACGPLG